MTKYQVTLSQTIETTVDVEADSAQQALALVEKRNFPLPPRSEWTGQKDWRMSVATSDGVQLIDEDGNESEGDADDAKAKVAAAIVELYPTASRYGVSSSDQGHAGYLLSDVGFEDGTVIDNDSDTFAALQQRLTDDYLDDLPWGSFGDRNKDSSFDVDIATGQIIR